MSKYQKLIQLTYGSIPHWWFEVAAGDRPVLECPHTNLDDLIQYTYAAADDSEEKYVGYLLWVDIISTLAAAATTEEEIDFVMRRLPPWYTPTYNVIWDKKYQITNPARGRAEYIEREGMKAGWLKRLELSETIDELWQIVLHAESRCPAVLADTFAKMVNTTTTASVLQDIHSRSLYWYPSKISSVRRMLDLHQAGKLET